VADRHTAGRYALRLEEIGQQTSVLRRELAETEATYAELTRARDLTVAAARDKLAALKRGIRELETQRALAELSEFTSGMHAAGTGPRETDNAHARLERLLERVEERRALAFGRARVAQEGLALAELRMLEADRTELAERALSRFEASATPRLSADVQASQATKIVS
jgi:IS5 family transposase